MMDAYRCLKTFSVLAVLALALFASPARAATVTGDVSIEFDFPPLLILYYYSSMDVTIDADDLVTLLGAGPGDQGSKSGSTVGATVDMGLSDPGDVASTNVTLDLQNTWAIRSVGGTTTVSASLLGGTPTVLSGPAGASIDIDTVAPSPTSVPATGFLGFALGDLSMDLDLASATSQGTYTAAGNEFRITAILP